MSPHSAHSSSPDAARRFPGARRAAVLALAALMAVVVLAWLAWPGGGGDAEREMPPSQAGEGAPVVLADVEFQSDAAVVDAVGTARAKRSVTLYPESEGIITDILFEAGQKVKSGAPLLRLDDEAERLALDLAKLQLSAARHRLASLEKVVKSGAVSKSEVDIARTAHGTARIAVSQAELALRRRTLRAPFAGVVGLAQVDVGDRVTTATEIASFDDRESLQIDFDVPEAFARGVRIGDAVEAASWAHSDTQVAGTVESFGSRIDPEARTLRVRARIPNEGDLFRPGTSFSVRLSLTGGHYPAVPSVAVQWDREGAHVWRVLDGKAERVNLRVLRRSGPWVLVDAPLEEGNRIVLEGVQRMRPGAPVREVPAADVAGITGQDHEP